MRKIFLIAACLALGFSAISYAADTLDSSGVLSLTDCFEKVRLHYPALKRQNARVEEAVAEKFLAYSALAPKIRGVSSVTMGDDPVYVFGARLRQREFTQSDFNLSSLNSPRHYTNYHFGFEGEIPVFNAFQTISNIRASHKLLRSENLLKEFTESESALIAAEGFLRSVLRKELVDITREVVALVAADLKQAEVLKDRGVVLGADFYTAKVMHGNLAQLERDQSAGLRASEVFLNILMGEEPGRTYRLMGALAPSVSETMKFGEWISLGFSNRKDLEALKKKIEAQRTQVFKEKASVLPKVNAFAEVTEDSHDMKTAGGNYLAGFRGSMDIIDASYLPRIKKAKELEKELVAEKESLEDSIMNSIVQETLQYEAARDNLVVTNRTLEDAREAVKLTSVLYQEGRKSIADLVEIRTSYLENAARRKELLFNALLEEIKLCFFSGTLSSEKLKEIADKISARVA